MMSTENADLSKDFIEEVRSASDIVRVVGHYVRLRKRGRSYLGLCPFHDEKTPSFNVNPERQMYYCFGCGAGGDVFKFLMQHENMGFAEAVVELAKSAGVRIPRRSGPRQGSEAESEAVVAANEAALEWFRGRLASEKGEAAREYLLGRGVGEKAWEAFEIGYAPDTLDGLQQALAGRFDAPKLIRAGLALRSETRAETIDRFRRRIILPIRSAGGRLVAFGGRILGEGEPKFLNSPETAAFNKSRNLYPLHAALRPIRKRGFAILVEGYFDAIVLHTSGFANAVAPLGTSLTEEQVKLLRRYCEKVIICMDGDEAGARAAVRAAGLFLERGFSTNIAPLPAGDDPDSLVRREGAEAFAELQRSSQSAYGFVLKGVAGRFDLSRPLGKREALRELLPMLDRVGEAIERSYAVSETAKALGVEEYVVASELKAASWSRSGGGADVGKDKSPSAARLPLAERRLLLLCAREPEAVREAVEQLEIRGALTPFGRALLDHTLSLHERGERIEFSTLAGLPQLSDQEREIAALAVEEVEDFPESAWECARGIKLKELQGRLAELNRRQAETDDSNSEKAVELLLEKDRLRKEMLMLQEQHVAPRPG